MELERAVERNEFGLEYQPIIDLGSGSIAAVEALLRWRHPLMGTIAPAEYLPLAEETGHIVPIGERVLDAATRQLRTWHLGFARMQSLQVNVNISPRQLRDDNLLPHITTVLQRSDLDPSSLTLELGTGCSEYPEHIAALADLLLFDLMGLRWAPAVADLDGDGTAEVIAGTYTVWVLNGENGTVQDSLGTMDHRVWPGVVVADPRTSYALRARRGGSWPIVPAASLAPASATASGLLGGILFSS